MTQALRRGRQPRRRELHRSSPPPPAAAAASVDRPSPHHFHDCFQRERVLTACGDDDGDIKGQLVESDVESNDDKVVRFPRERITTQSSDGADLAAGALKSGWLTQGSAAVRLQKAAETYLQRRVVPVAGGSAAMHLALLALDIGDGGEIIMPAVSSSSTANLVILAGGRPVFADIEAPDRPFLEAADANRLVGPRTRGLLTIHEAGYPARTDDLRLVADDRGLALVEDCRQALGATVDELPVGSTGRSAIYTFGDSPTGGGLVSTPSENLERHLITLRSTVIATDDECFSHDCTDGMTNGYRIDEAAASAGARALAELPEALARRRGMAVAVGETLGQAGLKVLSEDAGARADWSWLIALAPSRERRDELVSLCRRAGIEVVMPVAAITRAPHNTQLHRRALPNTRVYCDLALKLAVVPGLDRQLAALL
jgi:dTDP-4-amino-4,6-dideoxygalactose transaminase